MKRYMREGMWSFHVPFQKRLQKELLALQNDPPPGMTLNEKSVQNSITQWIVDMEGAPGTLYEGEKFQLLFKFSSRYPFDSPQRRPPDNSFYVRTCNKNPKKTKWWYHDGVSLLLPRLECNGVILGSLQPLPPGFK
ncbi:ubiquitin-conjugating enzyme E2 W isoform X11 [Symphalangus syndactylus]|uniref:ubiquitin-conjugating enzyme E2 W isoform X11 n=1 Tax=Symphalangus syndactylus TaxID=9590 RepID=UPI0030076D62